MHWLTSSAFATVALTLVSAPVFAAPLGGTQWQITITDLGVFPGNLGSQGFAINDTGKIVGTSSAGVGSYTVQWINGLISAIPVYSRSGSSIPKDMNDQGEIAGTLVISSLMNQGIYWDAQNNPFPLEGLPSVSGSQVVAHGINVGGHIVGRAQEGSPNFAGHAVIWNKATFETDLGFMDGGSYSEGYGINDAGDVVGAAGIANGGLHAFVWKNGQFTNLATWGRRPDLCIRCLRDQQQRRDRRQARKRGDALGQWSVSGAADAGGRFGIYGGSRRERRR